MTTPLKSLLAASLLFAAACAHPPPLPGAPPSSAPGGGASAVQGWDNSSIDLTYELGHIRRRLLAEAQPDRVVGQSFYEHQVLKESKIDSGRYQSFLRRSLEFIQTQQRVPAAQMEQCKNPFVLRVRVGAETRVHQGCRTTDDSSCGLLVREGEFLLYSKK
jgi:hypothetical protein